MKKQFLIFLLIIFLQSCASNFTIKNKNMSKKSDIYEKIYQKIIQNDLDSADNLYITLKNKEDSKVFDAASNLAIAHMAKKEYILANFYIQQMLEIDSSNEFARYLLNKNQFLAAKANSNNQKYIENALKAMQTNVNLVSDSEYKLLANSMLNRVKIENAWSNKSIGLLYKRLNKQKAYKLYSQKIQMLNIDIDNIYKPY